MTVPVTVTVLWVMFAMFGQWGLLSLLVTFGLVPSLPQAHNPFFINFLFTTFLATWPPCLLFFTGQQNGSPPHWLCLVQSVLMDGSVPMFGTSMAILVFHTWRTLKCKYCAETLVTLRSPWIKGLLILAPYVAFSCWCIASLATALMTPVQLELGRVVFCTNSSAFGTHVRESVGYYMFLTGVFQLSVEFFIACLVHQYRSRTPIEERCPFPFSLVLRILVLCSLQLTIVLLSALNSLVRIECAELEQATQVLRSMDGLFTFLIFGTQKDVLRTWRICKKPPPTEDAENKLSLDNVPPCGVSI